MRDGELVPIISGTSLGGAVRARALRIANTLFEKDGEALIDGMFGPRIEGQTGGADPDPRGSRVIVYESEIVGMTDKVQQRVKIDRFTGGAYPQALFAQQPLFADSGSETELHLELRRPEDHEIGLLLLVLKDLWTGDLALGGERSVGRGRMRGCEAALRLQRKDEGATTWTLRQPETGNPHLEFGGDGSVSQLEGFVEALNSYSPEGGKA
jgi:CRISPR/Cas system CSM-associated protein Csm3 (group 7 of RAMP superfamily)